jgi:excisionase family DNA binding protein
LSDGDLVKRSDVAMTEDGHVVVTIRLEVDDRVLSSLADRVADKLAVLLARPGAPAATPWMSAQAAADYIGCSLSRVRKLTMLGDLPTHRDGGRVLYRRDDLDAYIRSGGASTGR